MFLLAVLAGTVAPVALAHWPGAQTGVSPVELGRINAAAGAGETRFHAAALDGAKAFRLTGPDGYQLVTTARSTRFGDDGTWRLARLACDGQVRELEAAPVMRKAPNVVARAFEGVEEWYANGPLGLQFGVTFARAPACGDGGQATLVFVARSGADLALDGERVAWGHARMAGLAAQGADGKAHRVAWRASGNELRIDVDLRGASYPLVVDPFVQSGTVQLSVPTTSERLMAVDVKGDRAVIAQLVPPSSSASIEFLRRVSGSWLREGVLTVPVTFGSFMRMDVAIDADRAAFVLGSRDLATQRVNTFSRSVGGVWSEDLSNGIPAAPAAAGGRRERIDLDAGLLLVGATGDTSPTVTAGVVEVYRRQGSSYVLEALLAPPDADVPAGSKNQFGSSVGVSGPFIVATAFQGYIWLFENRNASWQQVSRVTGPNPPGLGGFGASVAIEGRTVVVGDSTLGAPPVGGVWIYGIDIATSALQQQGVIRPPTDATCRFHAVSINNGVIGAGLEYARGLALSAGGLIIRRQGTVWQVTDRLVPNEFDQSFYCATERLFASNAGSAFVLGNLSRKQRFMFDDTGSATTTPAPPVVPPTATTNAQFGNAVAVSRDFVVVASPPVTLAGGGTAGLNQVFVYPRSAAPGGAPAGAPIAKIDAKTTPIATLTRSGGTVGDKFGDAVAINPDGTVIVVGAPGANGGAGAVLVYRRMGATWTSMSTPTQTVFFPPVGNVAPGGFGDTVAVDDDGTIAAGAPMADVNGVTDAGAGVVLSDTAGTYTSIAIPVSTAPQPGANFGAAVDVDGTTAAWGAPNDVTQATGEREGAFYLTRNLALNRSAATDEPPPVLPADLRVEPPPGGKRGPKVVGDKFGSAVSIDQGMLAVGSPGRTRNDGAGRRDGAIFLYDIEGPQTSFSATLEPPTTPAAEPEPLGSYVEMIPGGVLASIPSRTIELPAPGSGIEIANPGQGSVAVFEEPATGWTGTSQPTGELFDPDGRPEDRFGRALAIGAKGGVVVGVPLADGDPLLGGTASDRGQAAAYQLQVILKAGFE